MFYRRHFKGRQVDAGLEEPGKELALRGAGLLVLEPHMVYNGGSQLGLEANDEQGSLQGIHRENGPASV